MVIVVALASVAGGTATARAQRGWSYRVSPFELLGHFAARCRAVSVDRDTGASAYHVYAYAMMERRLEPARGNRLQVFSRMEVCIFDRANSLARAREQYRAVQSAFRRHGGTARYRDFPFEDRWWRFERFCPAQKKARQLRRKSWLSYWPGVLNLQVEEDTQASSYFLFGYRPINIEVEAERDEEDGDITFRAVKAPWRLVIFDDREAAQAALRLYREYVSSRATLTDGLGNRVGEVTPYLEPAATFAQARRRADQLRRKLLKQVFGAP